MLVCQEESPAEQTQTLNENGQIEGCCDIAYIFIFFVVCSISLWGSPTSDLGALGSEVCQLRAIICRLCYLNKQDFLVVL